MSDEERNMQKGVCPMTEKQYEREKVLDEIKELCQEIQAYSCQYCPQSKVDRAINLNMARVLDKIQSLRKKDGE